jgi:FkbM family methyltransferase
MWIPSPAVKAVVPEDPRVGKRSGGWLTCGVSRGDDGRVKAAIERILLGDEPRPTRILSGPMRGARMYVNRSKQTRVWLGRYEPALQSELVKLGAPPLAFDVGAFQGFFSILLARICGRAVAVEPDPRNIAVIRRNLAMNDVAVEVVEAAAGASSGTTILHLARRPSENRIDESTFVRNEVQTKKVRRVRRVTLNDLAAEHGQPALVKIDVEGGEVVALEGASALLERRVPIACELHGTRDAVAGVLRSYGYEVRFPHDRLLIGT